jgi:hypothetical protein
LGYDPGEPYNAEHVRVKILEGRREATVAYRNRVQETRVPDVDALPQWAVHETWRPPEQAGRHNGSAAISPGGGS